MVCGALAHWNVSPLTEMSKFGRAGYQSGQGEVKILAFCDPIRDMPIEAKHARILGRSFFGRWLAGIATWGDTLVAARSGIQDGY